MTSDGPHPRYKKMPPIVGGLEIAAMLGVSKQRAGQLLDRRTNPLAPPGQQLAAGTFYLRADIEEYARVVLHRPIRDLTSPTPPRRHRASQSSPTAPQGSPRRAWRPAPRRSGPTAPG